LFRQKNVTAREEFLAANQSYQHERVHRAELPDDAPQNPNANRAQGLDQRVQEVIPT
jgi:hypothetical protein